MTAAGEAPSRGPHSAATQGAPSVPALHHPLRTNVPHVLGGMPRLRRSELLDRVDAPLSTSLAFEIRVGVLTHRVLAETIGAVRGMSPERMSEVLVEVARDAVRRSGERGRPRAALMRVATLVGHYAQRLAPPAFVEYVGAEQPVGAGRVDLLWDHPTLGVVIDEVKTWKNPMQAMDEDAATQASAYAAAAVSLGRPFAGVRLLPVVTPDEARLFRPDGSYRRLAGTELSPDALRAQQACLTASHGDMSGLPTTVEPLVAA